MSDEPVRGIHMYLACLLTDRKSLSDGAVMFNRSSDSEERGGITWILENLNVDMPKAVTGADKLHANGHTNKTCRE